MKIFEVNKLSNGDIIRTIDPSTKELENFKFMSSGDIEAIYKIEATPEGIPFINPTIDYSNTLLEVDGKVFFDLRDNEESQEDIRVIKDVFRPNTLIELISAEIKEDMTKEFKALPALTKPELFLLHNLSDYGSQERYKYITWDEINGLQVFKGKPELISKEDSYKYFALQTNEDEEPLENPLPFNSIFKDIEFYGTEIYHLSEFLPEEYDEDNVDEPTTYEEVVEKEEEVEEEKEVEVEVEEEVKKEEESDEEVEYVEEYVEEVEEDGDDTEVEYIEVEEEVEVEESDDEEIF